MPNNKHLFCIIQSALYFAGYLMPILREEPDESETIRDALKKHRCSRARAESEELQDRARNSSSSSSGSVTFRLGDVTDADSGIGDGSGPSQDQVFDITDLVSYMPNRHIMGIIHESPSFSSNDKNNAAKRRCSLPAKNRIFTKNHSFSGVHVHQSEIDIIQPLMVSSANQPSPRLKLSKPHSIARSESMPETPSTSDTKI